MLTLIVVALLLALPGCEDRMSDPQASSTQVNTELGTLPGLISLPKQPIEVRWEVIEQAQGEAGMLRVLLRYSEEDYAAVVEGSETFESKTNDRINPVIYDDWIIAPAKEGIEVVTKGRYYELVDVQPRKANLFWNAERSPYVDGRVSPLRNGYIYVAMRAS